MGRLEDVVHDFESRRAGCLKVRDRNHLTATTLYITAFVASAAATIGAELSLQKEVVAGLAAIPGIVAVANGRFKLDALTHWWAEKHQKLDDLVMKLKAGSKSPEDAVDELIEFLATHDKAYPGRGTPPSDTTK